MEANSALRAARRCGRRRFSALLLSSASCFAANAALAGGYGVDDVAAYNAVNVEDYLNALPQFIPGFDSTSNNPGDGTATLDLRGLGAERTLILIDGRRLAPFGGGDAIDVNLIPASLVERVDVVTGEGALHYGSGAVGGVVNFILKDDFEGVQLDASHELSAAGWDANTTNVSLTMGGAFAGGRGHAVAAVSYTNRKSVLQGDRAFSSATFQDPGTGVGAFGFEEAGSANIPGGGFFSPSFNNFGLNAGTNTNFAPTTTIADIDPLCGAAGVNCTGFRLTNAPTVNGFRFSAPPGQADDTYNYAPPNYLQLPQERYNIYGFGSFEINDHIEAYMRGIFSENVVETQLAPTPAFLALTINNDNPLIPATLLSLITGSTANNGDGTSTLFISKRYEEVGPRVERRDTTAFQIAAGLRGDLSDNWSYDAYFGFARSGATLLSEGGLSRSAIAEGVLCDGGPTAVASGCTAPFVNLFGGPGSISEAGAAFIGRTGIRSDVNEHIELGASATGAIAGLQSPWSSAKPVFTIGFQYREIFGEVMNDSVFGDFDLLGFGDPAETNGRYDIYEAFGEGVLPLIEGRPLIRELTISGGARWSEYSAFGDAASYEARGRWSPVEGLAFYAAYQKSHRAPSIEELFSEQTIGFPGAQDPCAGGPNGAFSNDVIISTCIEAGVPPDGIGANIQPSGQIQVLLGGNPNLSEEVADTLTIGAVWEPAAVDGLKLRVEYYDISVEDAITNVSLQTLLNECHLKGVAVACAALEGGRDPASGGIIGQNGFLPQIGNTNIGAFNARGVDFNVGYNTDIFGGALSMQYYGAYALRSRFQTSPSAALVECAGFYAGNCDEPAPEYKHAMETSFIYGPLTASLRWRAVGGVDTTVTGLSNLSDDIGFFNYLDVETQYAVGENLDLTVGVRNITGKDAPLLGSTVNEQANTWPATYETLGRRLYAGASLRF